MRKPGATIIAVSLAVVGGLSACVLPLPVDHVVGRAVTVDPLTIKIGETKREEVQQRLGDPDAIWVDERVFAYRWQHVSLTVIWLLAGGPYAPSAGSKDFSTDELLLVQFDDGGVAQRVDRTRKPANVELGDFLKTWAKRGPNAKT